MSEVLTHKKPIKHLLGKHIADVKIVSPANNEVLTFVAADDKWENKPAPAGAITYQKVDGTTDADTAATSPTDLAEMTLTVAETGTYLMILSMNFRFEKPAASDRWWMARMVRNGLNFTPRVSAIVCRLVADTIVSACFTMMAIRSLTAGDVVKCQWWVSTGDDHVYNNAQTLASYYFRNFSIIKLA